MKTFWLVASTCVCIFFGTTARSATTLTWNNGSGNFDWDTTSANWTGASTTFVNYDLAAFSSTGVGTITVSPSTGTLGTAGLTPSIYAAGLAIGASGYDITGGAIGFQDAATTNSDSLNITLGASPTGSTVTNLTGELDSAFDFLDSGTFGIITSTGSTLTMTGGGQVGVGTAQNLSGTNEVIGAHNLNLQAGSGGALDITSGTYYAAATGTGGPGAVNLSNATLDINGFNVGNGTTFTIGTGAAVNSYASVNGSGVVTSGNANYVGRDSQGTSTLDMTAGTALFVNGMVLDYTNATTTSGTGSTGIYNITGGTTTIGGSGITLIENRNTGAGVGASIGTGQYNQSGGTVSTTGITYGAVAAAGDTLGTTTASLSLSGGTLNVGALGVSMSSTPPGTSSFTLSGGTLGALANYTVSMNTTLSGNVTFNTSDAVTAAADTITVSGILSGTGGFTTSGIGTLSLTNLANTFQGPTLVKGGTLSANSLGTSNVTVMTGTLSLNLATAMAEIASLTVDSGGLVDLNYALTDTISALTVNGISIADGVYSASDLDTLTSGDQFSGTGYLNVGAVPEPSTDALLALGLGFLAMMILRRRQILITE